MVSSSPALAASTGVALTGTPLTVPVALPHFINSSAVAAPDSMRNADPVALPSAGALPSARPQHTASGHPAILTNRVREILWHIPWYGFKTQARLAQDSGVSPAAISRLIRSESQPSLAVALQVIQALSRRLGYHLDVAEVFSLDGCYPTPSVCHLTGCRNCLPPVAYDEEEELRPFYRRMRAGTWSVEPLAADKPLGSGDPLSHGEGNPSTPAADKSATCLKSSRKGGA